MWFLHFIGKEENERFMLLEMSKEQRMEEKKSYSERIAELAILLEAWEPSLGISNGLHQHPSGKQGRGRDGNKADSKRGPHTNQEGCTQQSIALAQRQ